MPIPPNFVLVTGWITRQRWLTVNSVARRVEFRNVHSRLSVSLGGIAEQILTPIQVTPPPTVAITRVFGPGTPQVQLPLAQLLPKAHVGRGLQGLKVLPNRLGRPLGRPDTSQHPARLWLKQHLRKRPFNLDWVLGLVAGLLGVMNMGTIRNDVFALNTHV